MICKDSIYSFLCLSGDPHLSISSSTSLCISFANIFLHSLHPVTNLQRIFAPIAIFISWVLEFRCLHAFLGPLSISHFTTWNLFRLDFPPCHKKHRIFLLISTKNSVGDNHAEHKKIEREDKIDLMRVIFLAKLSHLTPQSLEDRKGGQDWFDESYLPC